MTAEHLNNANTECIACREPIRIDASKCRYCGSSQKYEPWHKMATVLKWIGGVVTVISLLIGMLTLTGYYHDWRERHNAVTELVEAADWLIKSDNYSQAWQMYEDALLLIPSSAKTFRAQLYLAKIWLRNFKINKESADETLNSITAVLYRGIRKANDDEIATILAHVGWAQVLRVERSMPVFVDVGTVFTQALKSSPDNVYANAMSAYWVLTGRGVTAEDITLAQAKFSAALSNQVETAFVRRLQFSSLVSHSYGRGDDVEQAALAVLLRESFSMMRNGEAKPSENFRYKILDAYGTTSRAEHVEASISFMPAADHLAVHKWLMDGMDYGKGVNQRRMLQVRYIRARLTEAMGRQQEALQQYQYLLKQSISNKQLDTLVNKAIERLTGELPERALLRTYINDRVDENDPWSFHIDTLAHFDPKWQPENLDQAVEYFEKMIDSSNEKIPLLVNVLPDALDRVREDVRDGNERARLKSYTLNFDSGHHENTRLNLITLNYLYARALLSIGKLDEAIAKLGDMKILADKLGDNRQQTKAWAVFELARAYAIRAASNGNDMDSKNAVKYLKMFVENNGVNGDITTWQEIKSEVFSSIKDDLIYKELIRGR